MNTSIQFIDENDKNKKLVENADKFLIETQYHQDGNYLIFSDTKQLENQLAEIQDNQLTIMTAIADLYNKVNPT